MLYVAAAVIIILGTLVIFTFDPCPVVNGVQLPGGFCPLRSVPGHRALIRRPALGRGSRDFTAQAPPAVVYSEF